MRTAVTGMRTEGELQARNRRLRAVLLGVFAFLFAFTVAYVTWFKR